LGPRWDATLGARFEPLPWLGATLAVSSRVTGDVMLGARKLAGTGERLLSLALGAGVYDAHTGLRSSVTWSVDPPVGEFSRATAATSALSVALGFAR
jgi:hypothetical protein